MAIRVDGVEQKNLGLPESLRWFGRRETLWAWYWAVYSQGDIAPADYQNRMLREERISRLMAGDAMSVNTVKTALLPIAEFAWINDKGDRRQEIWLSQQTPFPLIDSSISQIIGGIPGLSIKDRYVLCFDVINIAPQEKRNTLMQMKNRWERLVAETNQLKWLNKNDSKQCEWARDYLRKSLLSGHLHTTFETENAYIAVLSAFDSAFGHPAEKSLFIIKMRDAWNQFKHREKNVDKAQCNFWLAKEAKLALDELAARKDIKKNALIEQLVFAELQKLNAEV